MLLRTLEESPALANLVRDIRITSDLSFELEREITPYSFAQRKALGVRVLRKVILACQNLEHLSGYAPMALKSASSLFSALSSCHNLNAHVWRLPYELPVSEPPLSASEFLDCHSKWRKLQTLVLWQRQDGYALPPGTVSALIQRLPSLKHLLVKGFHPTDFHNGTLLMLPGLRSLRLEELHGVTDQGLEQLAHSRLALSLERLTLCGLELTSLRTIQSLLANMASLRSFTLLQDTSPQLPQWCTVASTNFWLESATLTYLHWDIIALGHNNAILANSIAAGKFPKLRKVKVPCDNDGAIQNLCRPIAYRSVTHADLRTLEESETGARYNRSLRASEIQAQLRIRESRRQPSFNVIVEDEHEAVQHRHVIGSYIGSMASKIGYSLEPAIEGTEAAIAQIEDVAMPLKARLHEPRDGAEEQILDLSMLF